MKKSSFVVLAAIVFCTFLSGCGKKCDVCGVNGADYELFGYHLCWDCYRSVMDDSDEDKVKDEIEIVKQNLSVRSGGNYFDYEVTIKNNSDETLSYVKVNIYLKDASQNIIHSDWTNWSGSLPPGASTTLDTMIDYIDNVKYYSVSVADISID